MSCKGHAFGVPNYGNSCFFGSVVIALSVCPSLEKYLVDFVVRAIAIERKYEIHDLLLVCVRGGMWEHSRSVGGENLLLSPFIVLLRKIAEKYHIMRSNHQQDAHELFSLIKLMLDHESSAYKEKRRGFKIDIENHKERKEKDPFSGIFVQSLDFPKCLHSCSTRLSSFHCISLSLQLNCSTSLRDCLLEYTRAESIQGVFCVKCKVKQKSVKCIKFARLPRILCFHLNRLLGDHKIQYFTKFPLHLSVPNECISNYFPLEHSLYSLVAVIIHHGGPLSGHYTTMRRTFDGWVHVSDNSVRIVDLKSVLMSQAYMLFYERMD